MLKLLKICAYPLSLLYGCIVLLRNKLFDWRILPSESFNLPVISVGNLITGGTGKTPHIEYLVRLLSSEYRVAILSRGYGRKTRGFLLVADTMNADVVGDEMMQYRRKFPEILLAVSESRREGIKKLLALNPSPEVILLDDAFQHRYVKPGLSLLLTDYSQLYINDFMLPTGKLREFIRGASRANIICVTKSPKVLSPIVSNDINAQLRLKPNQKLCFTYIRYGNFVPLYSEQAVEMPKKVYAILLFAGIANTYPLEEYLRTKCDELVVIRFNDHHKYTEKDIETVVRRYKDLYTVNKIIVTTEKDAQRLDYDRFKKHLSAIPVFHIPMEIEIHIKYKQEIDNQILNYVRTNKANS